MSRSQRRAMIDREEPKLSLVRQCALLGISRSSLYYLPTEAGAEDLELMALIDQQYLKTPFYGSRRMIENRMYEQRRPNTSKPKDELVDELSTLLANRKREVESLIKLFQSQIVQKNADPQEYLAFYNQERPHQALGYRSPGQVFHAVSPQRCLLEHPQALQSDEGLRDTPAVDSLILASPLS